MNTMTPTEQSARDKASNAIRNAEQAKARIAERDAETAMVADLRAKVAACQPMTHDSRFRLRAITRTRAEDLMGAPAGPRRMDRSQPPHGADRA